jgi:hypothetical protein
VPIDLEALARGYAGQSDAMAQAQGLAAGPGLFIFVSLTMPRATLQGLVDQAARAKATIVIRGFANGSLRDTVAQVQGLIGKRQVAIQIDPLAFDRFAISKVPSFVWCATAHVPLPAPAAVAPLPTVSCGQLVTSAWITRWNTCSARRLGLARRRTLPETHQGIGDPMRRLIIWITLFCFVTTQSAAIAGPFEEGTAAGQAANPSFAAR